MTMKSNGSVAGQSVFYDFSQLLKIKISYIYNKRKFVYS